MNIDIEQLNREAEVLDPAEVEEAIAAAPRKYTWEYFLLDDLNVALGHILNVHVNLWRLTEADEIDFDVAQQERELIEKRLEEIARGETPFERASDKILQAVSWLREDTGIE